MGSDFNQRALTLGNVANDHGMNPRQITLYIICDLGLRDSDDPPFIRAIQATETAKAYRIVGHEAIAWYLRETVDPRGLLWKEYVVPEGAPKPEMAVAWLSLRDAKRELRRLLSEHIAEMAERLDRWNEAMEAIG